MKKKPKISDQELIDTINVITKKLAYKFKFGYHEIEDMKQQISLFALEGLKNYDHKRPLENFLWTHVRNRLFNFKRDNYQRPNKPCLTCPFHDPLLQSSTNECSKYTDKENCEPYNSWYSRNVSKKNLMNFITIEDFKELLHIQTHKEPPSPAQKELLDILEEKLTGNYRTIYLKIKMGIVVNKQDYNKLIEKCKELFNE